MKNKDIIKTLQKEIEIPDIVQKKADAAFAAVRREAGNSRSGSPMVNHPADGEEDSGQRRSRRKRGRTGIQEGRYGLQRQRRCWPWAQSRQWPII